MPSAVQNTAALLNESEVLDARLTLPSTSPLARCQAQDAHGAQERWVSQEPTDEMVLDLDEVKHQKDTPQKSAVPA